MDDANVMLIYFLYSQIKSLREEVQTANDQYKELTIALEQQQNQFTSLQVCSAIFTNCRCFLFFQLSYL